MEQIGKTLVFAGLGMAVLGGMLWLGHSVSWLRLGRLPGDIAFQRDGFTVFVPITTAILLSLLASGAFWLIAVLRR